MSGLVEEDRGIEAVRRVACPLPLSTLVEGPIAPKESCLGKLLCSRRSVRSFSGAPIPCEALLRLLVDSAGGVQSYLAETPNGASYEVLYRTIPQGGAIASVHLHLVLMQDNRSLTAGCYTLCPYQNTLHARNMRYDYDQLKKAMWWKDDAVNAGQTAVLIISADMESKAYKYGEKGYWLSVIEAGCALQNALLSICDQGLAGYAVAGFDPDLMASLLSLEKNEQPIVAVVMGMPAL